MLTRCLWPNLSRNFKQLERTPPPPPPPANIILDIFISTFFQHMNTKINALKTGRFWDNSCYRLMKEMILNQTAVFLFSYNTTYFGYSYETGTRWRELIESLLVHAARDILSTMIKYYSPFLGSVLEDKDCVALKEFGSERSIEVCKYKFLPKTSILSISSFIISIL